MQATNTRSAGLGLSPDLAWMVSGQLPEIYLNPAYAASFTDSFYFEYEGEINSGKTNGQGGVFLKLPGGFALGVLHGLPARQDLFNSAASPQSFFYDSEATSPTEFRAITNATHLDLNTAIVTSNGLALADAVSIFNPGRNNMGTRMASAFLTKSYAGFNFGLSGYYAFASDVRGRMTTGVDESIELMNSETGVALGVFTRNPGKLLKGYELTVSHTFYSLNNQYNENDRSGNQITAQLQSQGAGQTSVYAGADIELLAGHLFKIRGNYLRTDTSTRAYAKSDISTLINPFELEDNFTRTGNTFKIGISDEMRQSSKLVWFVGVSMEWFSLENNFSGRDLRNQSFTSVSVEQEMSAFVMPVQMGLEAQITERWQMRFGVGHRLFNRRSDGSTFDEKTRRITRNTTTGNTQSAVETTRIGSGGALSNAALGFSWNYGRYRADWLANINFISEGPNFMSGRINDVSLSMALVYRFDAAAGPEIVEPVDAGNGGGQ